MRKPSKRAVKRWLNRVIDPVNDFPGVAEVTKVCKVERDREHGVLFVRANVTVRDADGTQLGVEVTQYRGRRAKVMIAPLCRR